MTPARPSAAKPLEPRECGDQELAALVQRSAEPVVVESYHGGWERPWRALSGAAWRELLRELGERVNGALVETGRNRETAVRYGLEVIPTVLVFVGGQVVARFTGRVSAEEVLAAVRAALEQARARSSGAQELEAEAARLLTPVRSILRRFTGDALANAG
jgi:thioredoxin-like negative regulator of GroEL